MFYFDAFVPLRLLNACLTANAYLLATVTTPSTNGFYHDEHVDVAIFSPPALRPNELQRRVDNNETICGDAMDATNWIYACPRHARCTNTFIKSHHTYDAYISCYFPPSATDTDKGLVATTGVTTLDANQSCPPLATCCIGYESLVQTNYFVKSSYTVTGIDCTNAPPVSATWVARKNVIDPPKFRAERSIYEPQPFLTLGARIGIGVGVGVGLGLILIVGLLFWMRKRRLQRSRVEFSTVPDPDTPELAGKKDSYELGPTLPHSSELPSIEHTYELSTDGPAELPTDWHPPELRNGSK